VRARIDTIEEQIQQLMKTKLELQKVAKVVTLQAADGSETPPGIEPSVTGSPKDTGKGVGSMDHGPPVMPMHGQESKEGDTVTDEEETEAGAGVRNELTSGLRVSSKLGPDPVALRLDQLEAEIVQLKEEASSAHRSMCRMEAKMETWATSANPEFRQDGTGKPAQIDKKIIEKPVKYKGDIKVFIQWHERLKTYLAAQDKRWSKLLDAIEARDPNALKKDDDFTDISEEANVQE